MDKSLLKPQRKSHIDKGEIYFWTATINRWQRLLEKDEYKVDVFAFIIMPNHIHLIWRVNEPNGKESPQGSFLKYTAHTFKKMLRKEGTEKLYAYKVDAENKDYEFWQRDSLAIPLFTKKVAIQKLKYMHYNPLAEHWQLVKDPCDYKYSSARYYELDEKNFPFLKDLYDEF